MEGWAGMGEYNGVYSQSSGNEGRAWGSLEGWGLQVTIPHFGLAAEVTIGVMTVLLTEAGEKPFLGSSSHSLFQFNLYCTFPVGFMARSSEISVVSLNSLTLFPSPILSSPKLPLPGSRVLPSTLRYN